MATGFSEPIAEFQFDENGNVLTESTSNLKLEGTGEFTNSLLESEITKDLEDENIGVIGGGEGQRKSDDCILSLVEDIDELNRAAVHKSQMTLDNLHIELGIPGDETETTDTTDTDEDQEAQEILRQYNNSLANKPNGMEFYFKKPDLPQIQQHTIIEESENREIPVDNYAIAKALDDEEEEFKTEYKESPVAVGEYLEEFNNEEFPKSQDPQESPNSQQGQESQESQELQESRDRRGSQEPQESHEREESQDRRESQEPQESHEREESQELQEHRFTVFENVNFQVKSEENEEHELEITSGFQLVNDEDKGLLLASLLNSKLNSEFAFETKCIEDHRSSMLEGSSFWNCEEISVSNSSITSGFGPKVPNPSLCSLNTEDPLPPRRVFLGNLSEQVNSIIYEAERVIDGLSGPQLDQVTKNHVEISRLLQQVQPVQPPAVEIYSNQKSDEKLSTSIDNFYVSRDTLLKAIVSGEFEAAEVFPLTYGPSEGTVGQGEAKAALYSVLDRMLLIEETTQEEKDSSSTLESSDGKNVLPLSTQELFYEDEAKLNTQMVEVEKRGKIAAVFPTGSRLNSSRGMDFNVNFNEDGYIGDLGECKSEEMNNISPIVLNEEDEEYQANVEAELAAIQAEMSAFDYSNKNGEVEQSDTESLLEKIVTEFNSPRAVSPLKSIDGGGINRLGQFTEQEYKNWETDWLDSIANYNENGENVGGESDEETTKCFSWRIMFPCLPGRKTSLCGCDAIRREFQESRRRSKSVAAPKKKKTRRGLSLSRHME